MGLDQHAYSISKHEKHLLDTQEYRDGDCNLESEECLQTWRKHANLNAWMTDLAVSKGLVSDCNAFNCVRMFLEYKDLDALQSSIREGLPHGSGFFWGQSEDSDTEKDIEFIAKARYALNRGQEVYYYCWW